MILSSLVTNIVQYYFEYKWPGDSENIDEKARDAIETQQSHLLLVNRISMCLNKTAMLLILVMALNFFTYLADLDFEKTRRAGAGMDASLLEGLQKSERNPAVLNSSDRPGIASQHSTSLSTHKAI